MILRGRDLKADLRLDVDAVVIGTGAGGSIALRELARAGLRVVALEEGAHHTVRDFDQREDHMLPALFQESGARTTEDMAIRVLQGRGVGGSTVHNTNLCKRAPAPILELWAKKHGVSGASPAELEPAFAQIERELSVSTIPRELVNANNDVLRRGAEALGWKAGALAHNRVGCQMSGFCELGCAYDAKQNALKVIVPQAVAAGARVYADVQAVSIATREGRVTGVMAVARDAVGQPIAWVDVRARVVVLAASATGSAALVLASKLPDPHAQAGTGLRMHPGAVCVGRFDKEISGHRGIPQSWECTEHLDFEEGSDKRVWIVPAFAHPIGAAAVMPGFGAAHMRAMRDYTRISVLTAMVHDDTSGRVVAAPDGRPVLRYAMNESDRAQLAKGLSACAKILFSAGAQEVFIPAVPPIRLRTQKDLDALDLRTIRPHDVPLSAVHPMGTLRMGDDPKKSVVSSTGEHHFVRGLFVADGSLFPTSLGGPPQITIYAMSLHLAKHAVARARAA